jgi:hypothetical protein
MALDYYTNRGPSRRANRGPHPIPNLRRVEWRLCRGRSPLCSAAAESCPAVIGHTKPSDDWLISDQFPRSGPTGVRPFRSFRSSSCLTGLGPGIAVTATDCAGLQPAGFAIRATRAVATSLFIDAAGKSVHGPIASQTFGVSVADVVFCLRAMR